MEPEKEPSSFPQNSDKCRYPRTPWWKTAAEMIGIGAVVWYACVTNGMWKEMQEQTRIQWNTATNSERAWVGLADILKLRIIRQEPTEIEASADYSLKNFGHGPAFKINSQGLFVIGFQTEPIEVVRMDLERTAQNICKDIMVYTEGVSPVHPNPQTGITLFPDQIGEIQNSSPPTGGAIVIQKGSSPITMLYYVGCITYLDQFRKPHWTRFCFRSLGNGPVTVSPDLPWHYHFLYNDADEDHRSGRE